VIEERGLVEGDAAAHGARGEEALRLLVVGAGHRQAVGLVHPDGDFYRRPERRKSDRLLLQPC